MNIQRYTVYTEDGGPHEDEGGQFVYWDDIKDNIKIVDQQLAEIDSLKTELARLMSSLEQWDEVFK